MSSKILIISVLAFIISHSLKAQDTTRCLVISGKTIEFLKNNQPDSIIPFFDKQMTKSLTSDALAQIWTGLNIDAGKLLNVEKTKLSKFESYYLLETNLVFEGRTFKYRLSFDSQNQISGMFFVPLKTNKKDKKLFENENFKEVETYVKADKIKLPAIYCKPKNIEDFPIAILVHGSGPNDMDETIGPNKVFRDLAHGLANLGIATLRYDKRTYFANQNSDTTLKISGLDFEVINDALAAIELASRLEGVDPSKVFVIGHSLGAMCAPEIGRRSTKVRGVVLLAGNSSKLHHLILEQYNYLFSLDGNISRDEKKELKKVKKQIRNVDKINDWQPKGKIKPMPIFQDTIFWRDIVEYNQVETLKNLHKPALILNGERDYQVDMKQFEGWKNNLGTPKNIMYKTYPGLNHLFIKGEGKPNPQEYSRSGNVSEEVISDISKWIKTN